MRPKQRKSKIMRAAMLRIGSEDIKGWIIAKTNEGMTQQEQAEALGISRVTLIHWVHDLGITIQRVAVDKMSGDEVVIRSINSQVIDNHTGPLQYQHKKEYNRSADVEHRGLCQW
tara:strand:- start:440 stop:784 length:345 start_codon:yes stop_codon:yes gene_type:complete